MKITFCLHNIYPTPSDLKTSVLRTKDKVTVCLSGKSHQTTETKYLFHTKESIS